MNLSWEGSTIHQRLGRLVRQGNVNNKVGIFYYILDESTDVYRLLTIQRKGQWIKDLRSCQTATVKGGLAAENVDDDMLVSLARDKEKMRRYLREQRKERELLGQVAKAEKTFKLMCSFAKPSARAVNLEILQCHEAKIRAMEFIPDEVINEGIKRVQMLAEIQERRFKMSPTKSWERWVKDIEGIQTGKGAAPYTIQDLFEILPMEEPEFNRPFSAIIYKELLGVNKEYAPTFGERTTDTVPLEMVTQVKEMFNLQMINRHQHPSNEAATYQKALEPTKTPQPTPDQAPHQIEPAPSATINEDQTQPTKKAEAPAQTKEAEAAQTIKAAEAPAQTTKAQSGEEKQEQNTQAKQAQAKEIKTEETQAAEAPQKPAKAPETEQPVKDMLSQAITASSLRAPRRKPEPPKRTKEANRTPWQGMQLEFSFN